jgi:hypothetical protein
MPIRVINIGQANKGDGDPIRVAFDKVNKNFNDLNATITNISQAVSNIVTTTSLEEFDFGTISPNPITDPLQLLFFTANIDLGSIVEPCPVLYDAGDLE